MSASRSSSATAAPLTLETCRRAIAASFPTLPEREPLRALGEDWRWLVVETQGGVLFRFAKDGEGTRAQEMEARLLPFLRHHLSPAVPVPEWQGASGPDAPWGFLGCRRLPGRPLRPAAISERNVERLAVEVAQFLSELHGFPLARAPAFQVPGARAWRARYERLRDDLRTALRRRLSFTERSRLRRWWEGFLGDEENWSAEPALVHGGLGGEQILVDEEARGVEAVVGWTSAVVGDAAVDLAGLVSAYGPDFAWRVMEASRQQGMAVDGDFFRRARRFSALAPLEAVRAAARGGDAEALAAALARLRASAVLGA